MILSFCLPSNGESWVIYEETDLTTATGIHFLIFILYWTQLINNVVLVSGVQRSDSVLYLCAKLLQSCLTLCDTMDCSPPGFSVHGILQEKTLDWIARSFSRGSSWPRDRTHVSYISCIGRQVLYHWCHLGSPKIFTELLFCASGSAIVCGNTTVSKAKNSSSHTAYLIAGTQIIK